ncbi:hypothetical protein [Leucothrix arctica]|uniref:Uncharacterized protein n=1 Tax=Leucothrix arctica TaxID=1481894 RepID=A0A317C4D3_9GAMM|nr:hypothetical protein [Leucothrix arctica]PWQ93546.1 hypothetical protein DKT75_18175 [Leucothrix arctica]
MKPLYKITAMLSLLVLSTNSFATTPTDQYIDPAKIVGFIAGDWNNDGGKDHAILVSPNNNFDEDVGLYLFLEDNRNTPQLALFKPNLAWSGSMWGNIPSLALTAGGSLQVLSQNQAIGRNRWSQILTIAYRNKAFVVAGYTYESRDTLDLSYKLDCDVNLLTGKGVKNKKPFKNKAQAIKLVDWTEKSIPKQCQEE